MDTNAVILMESEGNIILLFNCPHCKLQISVAKNELACHIFRHGAFIENLQQINPHASKNECAELIAEKKIFGCAGPFQIIKKENETFVVEKCDYI